MTEKRFTYLNTTGWNKDGFLNVMNGLNEKNKKLQKENEQLKQFKEKVFDLIDKEIKETKEIFEDGKIDLITYNDSMIILTGLKEELKQ